MDAARPEDSEAASSVSKTPRVSRQFWQAGEFLPEADGPSVQRSEQPGLDHARLHPRFLHSNATSHKWALGALVELLDNSMDEVTAGCTYVNVDKVNHPVDGPQNPMLLVEDNGGGMDPSTIRNCMSFGFSLKHGKKMIGQYGNGFKTSTMRLGADALVLTKSTSAQTCSVGLLSYTFLTETNSQDVVVPIVDYSLQERTRLARGDENEWKSKLDMICEWGPFCSEAELWNQLDSMPPQGTRVYIWNLWQTSDNLPELDFITDVRDVLLRGHEDDLPESSGRKKKSDEGIRRCHSYRHSLRSYVSMLYLQWPEIVVRGKEVIPVPVTAGMKHVAVYDYRPRSLPKEETGSAQSRGPVVVPVYVGFAVEAPDTSVSGFCVYHRNRLIKPFWKVYTSASSVGRGVIGFLQVDFVEPAHDKQDFENTPPLQKLEKYLKRQVPHYWRTKSHLVGYQDHLPAAKPDAAAQEESPVTEVNKSVTPEKTASAHKREAAEMTPKGSPEAFQTPVKRQNVTGSGSGALSESAPARLSLPSDENKIKVPQKTTSKCLLEMQQHISQLQQSVQEFCNSYEIKEDAQLVLGRIFGTTMSRVMGPARELKRMCNAHVKGHRQALLFIAKSKKEGNLNGSIPQFIQAEMKGVGLDMNDALEMDGNEAMNGAEQAALPEGAEKSVSVLERKLTAGRDEERSWPGRAKSAGAETPDTVEDEAQDRPEEQRTKADVPVETVLATGPVEIEVNPNQWLRPTARPRDGLHDGFGNTSGQSASEDLAQIGLSVVEQFLKKKPTKLGVVQLAPNSRDVHKRGFASGSNEDPLEVVNLSEEVTVDVPPPKRLRSTAQDAAPDAVDVGPQQTAGQNSEPQQNA